MVGISKSPDMNSVNNINRLAESHKTNSVANFVAEIRSSSNTFPLKSMLAISTYNFSNSSGKLPDILRQELQELVKTPDQQSVVVERFFSGHMIPLLKAELNKSFSDEQLKAHLGLSAEQSIDDTTLVKLFLNGPEVKGKLDRFDNAMKSYHKQKNVSDKEFHLNEAFRALEESVELLCIPDLSSANNEPESTNSTEPNQPIPDMTEAGDRVPVNDSAKPQIPAKGGDVHYHTHYHFGESIHRVVTDKDPVKVEVTVRVNSADATSSATAEFSEKTVQQEPNTFGETKNTGSHKLDHQQHVRSAVPEKKMSVMENVPTQISSPEQDIDTQYDDVIDGFISENNTFPEKIEIGTLVRAEPATVIEEQPSMPAFENQRGEQAEQPPVSKPSTQSEPAISKGGYTKTADGWVKNTLHNPSFMIGTNGFGQTSNPAEKTKHGSANIQTKATPTSADLRNNFQLSSTSRLVNENLSSNPLEHIDQEPLSSTLVSERLATQHIATTEMVRRQKAEVTAQSTPSSIGGYTKTADGWVKSDTLHKSSSMIGTNGFGQTSNPAEKVKRSSVKAELSPSLVPELANVDDITQVSHERVVTTSMPMKMTAQEQQVATLSPQFSAPLNSGSSMSGHQISPPVKSEQPSFTLSRHDRTITTSMPMKMMAKEENVSIQSAQFASPLVSSKPTSTVDNHDGGLYHARPAQIVNDEPSEPVTTPQVSQSANNREAVQKIMNVPVAERKSKWNVKTTAPVITTMGGLTRDLSRKNQDIMNDTRFKIGE